MTDDSREVTDGEVEDLALQMLRSKRGVGMKRPFYAESASRTDQSWPYWIVRNTYCNSLGFLLPRESAERLADAMNKVSKHMDESALDLETKDEGAYYSIPEEALQHLPEEWRNQLQEKIDAGRVVLKSVDNELSQLVRLLNSFTTLVTLKHVQKRLWAYKFEPNMDALLELEMLTTAFVVTYARLHHGGNQSGFSRDSLPEGLRPLHDRILDLRNKRFAHHDDHDSVSSALEVTSDTDGSRFEVKFGISLEVHIGGHKDWPDLVRSVETIYHERIDKLLEHLKKKTGKDWGLREGPPPEKLDDAGVSPRSQRKNSPSG